MLTVDIFNLELRKFAFPVKTQYPTDLKKISNEFDQLD